MNTEQMIKAINIHNRSLELLTKITDLLTVDFIKTLKVNNDLSFCKRSKDKIELLIADLKAEYKDVLHYVSIFPAKWQTILQDQKVIEIDITLKDKNYREYCARFSKLDQLWYNHNKPLPNVETIQAKQLEHKALSAQIDELNKQLRQLQRDFKINKYSDFCLKD